MKKKETSDVQFGDIKLLRRCKIKSETAFKNCMENRVNLKEKYQRKKNLDFNARTVGFSDGN